MQRSTFNASRLAPASEVEPKMTVNSKPRTMIFPMYGQTEDSLWRITVTSTFSPSILHHSFILWAGSSLAGFERALIVSSLVAKSSANTL